MAAEMPARVAAIPGARVVDFPWADATAAVAALNDASATLGTQLETRVGMIATIVDWEGTYRDEFDATYSRLKTSGEGLKTTLANLASAIVGGAEDANQEQRTANSTAEEAANNPQPVPSGGRNIPI
jgi:uncharacterized protein YukE